MKSSKYILLVIGILGLASGIYGLLKSDDLNTNIIGLVCGASLVWGYFELDKAHKKQDH